jgi:uncharacterized protein YjiS (DUF1127 family)
MMRTQSAFAFSIPSVFRQIPAKLSSVYDRFRLHAAYREGVRGLNSLDDRLLEDIGLSRGDIPSAARAARRI